MTEQLWTIKEVAKYLRVSPSWAYKASARGELPTVRLGAHVRFSPDAIKAWAAVGAPKPSASVSVLRPINASNG